jgi:predicted RNA-binding Zn-ribbon protein involved in translation (DUF1610 family)
MKLCSGTRVNPALAELDNQTPAGVECLVMSDPTFPPAVTFDAENDGYGIVGWSFTCPHCGYENRFVDEEDSEHECGKCGAVVRCKAHEKWSPA